MSNIHFTSDTHWGHANVITYSQRPFASIEEMNETFITNWNAVVRPQDTVWHLGDVAFCSLVDLKKILRRLNGTKNVVLGNHDKLIIKNKRELLETGLLASVQPYYELKHEGQLLVLFHYGQRVWNRSHHGSIMLYGHSHGSLPPYGKSVDVGVDSKEITTEYRPYSIKEILAYMEKRTSAKADHHG